MILSAAILILAALALVCAHPIRQRCCSRAGRRPDGASDVDRLEYRLRQIIIRAQAAGAAYATDVTPALPCKPPSAAEIEAALPSSLFHQLVIASPSASDHSEKHISPNSCELECGICLQFLEDTQRVRRLPACAHTFHADCIDPWFARVCSCPFCRTAVSIPKLAHLQLAVAQELAPMSTPAAQGSISSEAAISYITNGASLAVNNDDDDDAIVINIADEPTPIP
ncbi:hypothetical protein L7F22_041907 [Adiantum nelumboides]|nr:hypothetical protein [Adiantum nelumboides]